MSTIAIKQGQCLDCLNKPDAPLIAKRCKTHYWIYRTSLKGPEIQKTLKQTTDGRIANPFKISAISKSRAIELRLYEKNKAEHFKEYPGCQYPGCESTKIQLHHAKGRCGDLLTDKRYFKSLCDRHHRFCELHPLEGKKLELSFNRI